MGVEGHRSRYAYATARSVRHCKRQPGVGGSLGTRYVVSWSLIKIPNGRAEDCQRGTTVTAQRGPTARLSRASAVTKAQSKDSASATYVAS